MARQLTTQALVLDSRDHGEADLILTFLSPDHGRFNAIAKSAKKSKRRFVNKLEPFSYLQVNCRVRQHSSLAFLSEARLLTPFPDIRKSPARYAAATVIREVLLTTVKDGAPDTQLFRLTLWGLHRLDTSSELHCALCLYLLRFLGMIGYQPELDKCALCATTSATRYSYNLQAGKLVCNDCNRGRTGGPQLELRSLRTLQMAQTIPLNRLHRIKLSANSTREALGFLQHYLTQLLQRDLISWKSLFRYELNA